MVGLKVERNLTFLLLSLPDLDWGQQVELVRREFEVLFKENLLSEEWAGVKSLLFSLDIENIRNFWLGNSYTALGNWDEEMVPARLVEEDYHPPFLRAFLEKYGSKEERLNHFSSLLRSYYAELIASPFELLRWWGNFSLNLRETLSHLRQKKFGLTGLEEETSEAVDLEEEVSLELESILSSNHPQAVKMAESLLQFQFNQVEEKVDGTDLFSLDRAFGYAIKWILLRQSQAQLTRI